MTVGLFVGRFQPFHNGHLKALEYTLAAASTLVIGVGSSQQQNKPENPFSFDERKEMIEAALSGCAGKFEVRPIPDFGNDEGWVKYIRENLPAFDMVYTNSGPEASIFSGHRFVVDEIPFFDRKKFSATEVRNRMLSGGNWRELVPASTVEFIERVNGVERIRNLAVK